MDDSAWGPVAATFVDVLRHAVANRPSRRAFTFLADGESAAAHLSYGQLDVRARAIAAELESGGSPNERVLLIYPPGLDFVAGFLGCLYAGKIAVPTYPPSLRRPDPRLAAILHDAKPGAMLTTAAFTNPLRRAGTPSCRSGGSALPGDRHRARCLGGALAAPTVTIEDLALLQYTSGSTGVPKGVMVSHGNLLHNQAQIRRVFEQSADSIVVSWLPPYHDMGLIGGILQPLYAGASCVLMPPVAFLQQPIRWLRAIGRYRATTSGGPNFAYDLCAAKISEDDRRELDLSSWQVAFNGAEPVRAETLDRFAAAFELSGFSRRAYVPCYGLAESTLLVSGSRRAAPVVQRVDAAALERNRRLASDEPAPVSRRLVGCGRQLAGDALAIVDPAKRRRCPRVGSARSGSAVRA